MKEKFLKSTIILTIGSIFTKLLGIIIRMSLVRTTNTETINLYMLILPTFSLMMALSQLGFSTRISQLVSENRYQNKKILFSILPISFLINLLLTIFLIISSSFIANNLLHNEKAYLPILAISLVLPFDSLSSILRGFFFGKEQMFPHIISQLIEQIVRLILIIIIIPSLTSISTIHATIGLVLVNTISELAAALILLFFLPKNFSIQKKDLKPNYQYIKDILAISLPNTTTRIIGTIGYFLEPIILTHTLNLVGYTNNYIIEEYGIINAFIMPILLLPSFFTNAISNAMLPIVSREYIHNNINYIKRKLNQTILYSLLIGLPISILIFIFPHFFLNFFYKTSNGIGYLRFLLPFFTIYYIEIPLSLFLQAINRSKVMMFDNIIGIILKTILLFLLSYLKIGLYSLIIAIIFNIIIVTTRHFIQIKNALKNA